ncbi:hypothetical protein MLC59_18505 [Marinobacter bryozoorum]|jgi:hypothetical protein|uniref:hypothetical protein n=1 Tax=Marinobacter bryozoorum TaxID=256324 RepID=UPI0020067C55|nr:hypothetical protein [Marinobacter bryozoorum]MCK7546153.1 hypothetical protein [Marinobacter bryozoorum]
MPSNPLFEQTVTALMAGEVICEYRFPDCYTYLLKTEHRQRVADFLDQINRTLRTTSSRDTWVCAYQDLSAPEAKEAVRQQFREVANHLEAFVQFLRLVMNIETTDRPIAPGDHLKEGRMIDRVSNVPTLADKLRSLSEKKPFQNKRSDVAGRIRAVLDALVVKGYLVRFGTSGSVYQATGKWTWMYDVMTFIQTHEGIHAGTGDDEEEQLRLA